MKASVEKDGYYRATIRLGFFEGLASNDTIAGKLLAAGFVNVTVQGTGRNRWAEGTWPLDSQHGIDLPEQITFVERLR